ncbi:GNAT family N-acetyltransferase [Aeoliella sp. ICT_H6.2]|uniref:GNAT family N-acetyltransferase n=1 Tax=Aeoliella straminimaris TaxID=2954799 RepID=A0A9X2FDB5_9BACT|nr:GNAT family N-acetyltransferase [Aeoliella straminimaris]MCO6046982.1 GNAT family N-acetyltransferase [Aeoliella straminimaris]
MAEVTEINHPSDLAAYRATWNALLARTANATFFQTLDWLEIFWQHFGDDQRLRVLVVEEHGQAIGIVPLCVRTQQHRLGPLRTLTYPLDGWDNFYAPLGDRPMATLTAAIAYLGKAPRDWDRVQLVGAIGDMGDGQPTRQSMTLGGMRPTVTAMGVASLVDLAGDWESYLASRSAKTRHMLRRHLREVQQSSGVEYLRHRPQSRQQGDGQPRWDLFDQCQQVAEQSWQSHSVGGNTLCHPRYRDFYRDAHAAAARLGMLDLNLLLLDGQAVAFNYNYLHRGRLTGLRMGFAPQASQFSAGMLLMAAMLRDSCERGDALVDLGAGNQPFKCRLRTDEQMSHQLTYTPLSAVRCQALRLARWVRGETSVASK